jgi:hypothetical protein
MAAIMWLSVLLTGSSTFQVYSSSAVTGTPRATTLRVVANDAIRVTLRP